MNKKAERYSELSKERVRKRRVLQKLQKDYSDGEPAPKVFCVELESNVESKEKLCEIVAEKLAEDLENSDVNVCSEIASELRDQGIDDLNSFMDEFETECKKKDEDFTITDEIRQCVQESGVELSVADQLLKKLKKFHAELPLCIQTLMKKQYTFKNMIKKFDPGNQNDNSEIVYFGILEQLKRNVCMEAHADNILKLQFHIDGLSLSKSGSKQFWPILGKIYVENHICSYKPFTILVYCGNGKPCSPKLYLNEFVSELKDLLKNGAVIKERKFEIRIMCFICDRPARAFIKCIKGHTTYWACERCEVKGITQNKRRVYPGMEYPKRTNAKFRGKIKYELDLNRDHHLGISPLVEIEPLDMERDFVLDTMHLGYLNLMKRLLSEYWMSVTTTKLSRENLLKLSQRIVNLSSQITTDFQRTTRSLGEISKWKASEFRFFLLYCGPFVLKDILPYHMYKHFMLLHTAFRIMCSDRLLKLYGPTSEVYIQKFVLLAKEIYGLDALILSMHSVGHLYEASQYFNCSLSDIDAFSFESALGLMKDLLKSGNKPLIQLCNRMEEQILYSKSDNNKIKSSLSLLNFSRKDDTLNIKRIKYFDRDISINKPNNYVLLKNNTLLEIEQMWSPAETLDINTFDNLIISGKNLEICGPAFEYPCDSSKMDIYKIKLPDKATSQNPTGNKIKPTVQTTQKTTEIIQTKLSEVKCKMLTLSIYELPFDGKQTVAIPLLH